MAALSDYEKLRQKNIADNKKILAELGLLNPFEPLPRVIKKAPKRKRQPDVPKPEKRFVPAAPTEEQDSGQNYGSQMEGSRRRSSRLTGQAPLSEAEISDQAKKWREEECEEDEEGGTPRRPCIKRPMAYGAIPGVEVGTVWPMRLDCNAAGIHRPTVAGIHGGPEGAYSIVLSGGYEDNIDLGTCFTYTGEGGRDLKGTVNKPKNLRTAPQSKDQCLSRGNAALVKSTETNFPVRVVRGFKLTSPFAPEEGYRYDGLYNVEKYWYTVGVAGYGVFKFALKRQDNQAPPPWTLEGEEESTVEGGTQDSGFGSEAASECGSDKEEDTKKSIKDKAGSEDNKVSEKTSQDDKKISKTKDAISDNKEEDETEKMKEEVIEDTGSEVKQEVGEEDDGKKEVSNQEQEIESGHDGKKEISTDKQEVEIETGGKKKGKKSKTGNETKQEVESGDDGKKKGKKSKTGSETTQEVESGDDGKKKGKTSKTGSETKQEVESGDGGKKEGDKENMDDSTQEEEQKKKAGRRLSGKGGKQVNVESTQKNTMLKYFNKT